MAAAAGATAGEGEAAASGGGTGACSGRTGACSSTEACCAATACWGACSAVARCWGETGCSSASAAGFLLQPVKAKATLKTSNREVRFTGRSLGQLRAGATELCGGREHWSGQREFTFHRAKLGQFCSLNWKSRYCSKPGLGTRLSLCPSSPN